MVRVVFDLHDGFCHGDQNLSPVFELQLRNFGDQGALPCRGVLWLELVERQCARVAEADIAAAGAEILNRFLYLQFHKLLDYVDEDQRIFFQVTCHIKAPLHLLSFIIKEHGERVKRFFQTLQLVAGPKQKAEPSGSFRTAPTDIA